MISIEAFDSIDKVQDGRTIQEPSRHATKLAKTRAYTVEATKHRVPAR